MNTDVQFRVLIEQIFGASASPEQLDELIKIWDAQAETQTETIRLAESASAHSARRVASQSFKGLVPNVQNPRLCPPPTLDWPDLSPLPIP